MSTDKDFHALQSEIYKRVQDLHAVLGRARQLPTSDMRGAQNLIADALMIVLRSKPIADIDRAQSDVGFQSFKARLLDRLE